MISEVLLRRSDRYKDEMGFPSSYFFKVVGDSAVDNAMRMRNCLRDMDANPADTFN